MKVALRTCCLSAALLIAATAVASGVDVEKGSITVSLRTEPPSLDTSLAEDTVSSFVLRHLHEGLVTVDQRGNVKPAIAESWEISEQQIIFKLNPAARWSDGKPITADQFVYAWRRLVDPATGASGSTVFADVLHNASAIIGGELPPEQLGVKALDDATLAVTTSRPVPYLLEVLATSAFYPLREDIVNKFGERFAAEAENMVFSGPFTLTEWTQGASLSLARNTNYWQQNQIRLNQIRVGYVTSDSRALLNLFVGGELAALALDNTILEDAIGEGLRLRQKPNHCYSQITLNMRPARPTANLHLRKALQYTLDPAEYVNRVINVPGTQPLYGPYTQDVKGLERSFSEEYPPPFKGADRKRAKSYLAQATAELGSLPELVLLSREGNDKQDEYLQSLFSRHLGLTVKIDRQTFKQAIARLIAGDFDLAFSGFCNGRISDPDIPSFNNVSTNPWNDGAFNHPRYDELFKLQRAETDNAVRMKYFSEMQQILYDEAALLPTHQTTDVYVQDRRVRGLVYGPARNFGRAHIR